MPSRPDGCWNPNYSLGPHHRGGIKDLPVRLGPAECWPAHTFRHWSLDPVMAAARSVLTKVLTIMELRIDHDQLVADRYQGID